MILVENLDKTAHVGPLEVMREIHIHVDPRHGVLPLARHLWRTPASAPTHLPQRTGLEDQAAAAIDRYSARWGMRE